MKFFLAIFTAILISISNAHASDGNLAWTPPNLKKCEVIFKGVRWSFKQGSLTFGNRFPEQTGFVNKKRKVWLEKSGSNAIYKRKKGTVIYTLVGLGAGQTEGVVRGPFAGKYICK
jgi:hypothetical protein